MDGEQVAPANVELPMIPNASMPDATVIPVLAYPDVSASVDWLCNAFGFRERLRIGDHRAQLAVGAGAVVVVRGDAAEQPPSRQSVMVRVRDVDGHCACAARFGARILQEPTTYPYGERQYTAVDPAGHVWTFSESVANVHPESWGGTLVENTNGATA